VTGLDISISSYKQ